MTAFDSAFPLVLLFYCKVANKPVSLAVGLPVGLAGLDSLACLFWLSVNLLICLLVYLLRVGPPVRRSGLDDGLVSVCL